MPVNAEHELKHEKRKKLVLCLTTKKGCGVSFAMQAAMFGQFGQAAKVGFSSTKWNNVCLQLGGGEGY